MTPARRALARRTLLGALGTLPLTRLARGRAAHRLTVLHLNDFHSRHEAVDGRALACGARQPGCFGGSARLATALARERAAAEADGRAVLLLDAGDQFQGSLFYTAHRGMAELAVMHALGTEAMALGNHEFDAGPEALGRFVAAARFPVLSANLDATEEPALAGLVRSYAVFERAGLRVGVVGLTTPDTAYSSSPGPRVRFLPPGPALARASAAARAEGAGLVIALSHLGVGRDAALGAASGAASGAAVIVGGHSHTLLSNAEAGALGPYPTVAPAGAPGGTPPGGTLVVQAGAYGRYLGRLDLDLDAGGRVLAYGGECRHVGLDLPEDPAVAAIVAGYAAPLEAVRRRVIAHLPAGLDAAGCRFGACALGELVAQALLDASPGADVALMNAGGLRTGLRAGSVALADVLEALPFGNALATLRLRGADLAAAVEHGLTQIGRGGFPHLAGLRWAWDAARVLGARPMELLARGPDGAWAPLDPAREYRLVTNDFLRRGGDGYAALRDRAIEPYDAGPGVAEVVAEALGRMAPATAR